MSEDDPKMALDDEQMKALVGHLKTEEQTSLESTLKSVSSLQAWISQHPAMRQMPIVDSFSEIGPTILRVLRILLGLEDYKQDTPKERKPS